MIHRIFAVLGHNFDASYDRDSVITQKHLVNIIQKFKPGELDLVKIQAIAEKAGM